MSITGAFSSLGINERRENASEKEIRKNCSTISLPNMVLSERPKFIQNVCDDEVETTEQPVDFSKKYCETKLIRPDKDNPRNCTFKNVVKSYNTFTIYAETDLDQPTDYSLRYAEDDSDSDRCNKTSKTEATEFVQDTVKTYCTEDTPYETPFNFSTATSMSDLRIDDKAPIPDKIGDSKVVDVAVKEISSSHRGKIKSEFSSGLMSPEKPVNYCEEGTPGYFSRVASCGSLNSIPVNDPPKQEISKQDSGKKELRRVTKFPAEPKAVKFEEVVNYAEETPLMFSRSSSLASLDSIEQHSIHDDRSSVVSDFSRVTSGVISPSELPDSPSQTVPPSPRPRKTVLIFPPPPSKTIEEVPETAPSMPKSSVFEDVVKKFKVESTPLHFSAATSLSSLIDDEVDSKVPHNQDSSKGEAPVDNKIGTLNNLDLNNDLSEDSEDEDILAACINIGMQSNRYSQPKTESPSQSNVPSPYKFPTHSDNVDRPVLPLKSSPFVFPVKSPQDLMQKTDVTFDSLRTYCTEGTPALLSHAGSNSDLSVLSHLNEKTSFNKDSLENDKHDLLDSTIAAIENGHEEFSMPEKQTLDNSADVENCSNRSRRSSFSCLSDDSHESEEALLEECMLAGMPKSNGPCKSVSPDDSQHCVKNNSDEVSQKMINVSVIEGESSDDDVVLEDCIKMGMENNRYTQTNLKSAKSSELKNPDTKDSSVGFSVNRNSKIVSNQNIVNDTVKNYCTEDTPAILSHAGSCSNLSALSTQSNENEDCNSNFSDEDDERLLEECVKYGIDAITGRNGSGDNRRVRGRDVADGKVDAPKIKAISRPSEPPPDDDDTVSSLSSSSSFESEQALQRCIKAGMPQRTHPRPDDSGDLTFAEKALLQQCILEGMKKCRSVPKRQPEEDPTELTEAEQALLRHCIISGMPKNRNHSVGGASGSRESTELTESERLLLQQCILAGMPKSRNRSGDSRPRRPKEGERGGVEHTCCVHCPKNKAKGNTKGRKKYKDRGVVQVRESRDVNIVYVTSQILTVKKEVVERTRGNWV